MTLEYKIYTTQYPYNSVFVIIDLVMKHGNARHIMLVDFMRTLMCFDERSSSVSV